MDGAKSENWSPFVVEGEKRQSRWLVIADHAANTVPPWVNGGTLGLPNADMERHIAYDVGAAGVAVRLAEKLGAPALLSNFSRLVIDPNRGEDDPTLVMQLYDGSIIPANSGLSDAEIAARLDGCYRPYHNKLAELAARQSDTVIVSIHSFTPQFKHRPPRPWHVGLLFADDERLSRPLISAFEAEPGHVVGANQPYSGHLKGDTIDRHAIDTGRHNTLIEIRNDLIEIPSRQEDWAERCARLLPKALAAAEAKGDT